MNLVGSFRRRWAKYLMVLPVLATAIYGATIPWKVTQASATLVPAKATTNAEGSVSLPISLVVLFNSGMGYFSREGQVEGDARVDLTFPESDINDLLKSMTLQDFGQGRISAVSYDSRAPISRTLSSFAVNLNNNPTLADVLQQTRGEKVELTLQPSAVPAGQNGTLKGVILGLETQKTGAAGGAVVDVSVLNLLTEEGLRSLKLGDVLRLKFLNPTLENELRRALDVLSLSHDTQKKAVQLSFSGQGARKVRVSYVTEAPMWKTSYRLILDGEGKPLLQGWAHVENPTDEDWSNIKMVLVSGRPISFKMDLYNPLYVPRPTVEPELFAGLRPPTYESGFDKNRVDVANGPALGEPAGGFAGGGMPGGLGSAMPKAAAAPRPQATRKREENAKAMNDRDALRAMEPADRSMALQLGAELESRMQVATTDSATAGQLGDYFQYIIPHTVNLNRQKSAMLPILTEEVSGERISIYNSNVQTKHPLLGYKFKNTTKFNLAQGPVTVFEGSSYAGDARILDVQPNDSRLLANAIDLGTEVIPQDGPGTAEIIKIRVNRGILTTERQFLSEKIYKVTNRSTTDRVLYIEHPNRTNQGFQLVDTPKPIEETAGQFRFELKVPAGKSAEFKVKEQQNQGESVALANVDDNLIRFYLNQPKASESLKAKLREAASLKQKVAELAQQVQQIQAELNQITQDQDRIRKNLRETPREAPVYEIYLKKLSDQEQQIDRSTARLKELNTLQASAQAAYEKFLLNFNDE